MMIDGPIGPLALHDLGGGGDHVLLIAHANGFLGRVYGAFARELSSSVRVVAIDLRGHGDSVTPPRPEDFAWTGMADDLAAAADHLDASVLHGFGHSMGGAALLEVERRHAGTFTSAFVFEPIVPPEPLGNSPLIKAARARRDSFPTRADALERYASKPPLGLFRADVLYDYVHHGFHESADGVTLKCLPESEANSFRMGGRQIRLRSMQEIELPVVIGVSRDTEGPALLAPAIAKALPNGRLRSFPTMSHFGPLQDPVTIARAMDELLDEASEV